MNMTTLSKKHRRSLGQAGLETFFNIARDWGLTEAQMQTLLGVPRSTLQRWKRAPERAAPDVNHLERLSLLLGIYKALEILLPRPEAADRWVHRPNENPLFGGQPPIGRMLSGQVSDLFVVRQYLDARRGVWA